jgi:capsular polysaccharide biosynthesis protein
MDQRANKFYGNQRQNGAAFAEQPLLAQQRNEDEIDLMEILSLLVHHAWIFALAALIGALLIGLGVKLFVPARYTAKSTIYVFSTETENSTQSATQAVKMIEDFRIIATTRETIKLVSEELQKEGLYLTVDQIVSENKISVTNPPDSHMLRIAVTNRDAAMAARVSNALADVMCGRIADIMNSERPRSVETAEIGGKSSPYVKRDALIGGLAFALIAIIVVLVRYFVNDTITTEEDVNRYLGLTILSSVPFERNMSRRS